MTDWHKEKEEKRAAREQRQLQRALAAPPARGELLSSYSTLQQHVASVAIAIEAMEELMMTAGVLKEGELMAQIKIILERKQDAAQAQSEAEPEGRVQLAS